MKRTKALIFVCNKRIKLSLKYFEFKIATRDNLLLVENSKSYLTIEATNSIFILLINIPIFSEAIKHKFLKT